MSDITVGYKGNTIATMDASGTKTLQTSGKYCEGDISIVYSKPSGPSLTNLITNGDFSVSGATTDGWYAVSPQQSSIAISGGKLVLTHTATTNRNYGVRYPIAITQGHIYLIRFKVTKTESDDDSDSKTIIVTFGKSNSATQRIGTYTGLTQGTVLENVCAVQAIAADDNEIRFTFQSGISTAASNNSMMEFSYVEMYDITDIVGGL